MGRVPALIRKVALSLLNLSSLERDMRCWSSTEMAFVCLSAEGEFSRHKSVVAGMFREGECNTAEDAQLKDYHVRPGTF